MTPYGGEPAIVLAPERCTCSELPQNDGKWLCAYCLAHPAEENTRGHVADPDAIEIHDNDGEVD